MLDELKKLYTNEYILYKSFKCSIRTSKANIMWRKNQNNSRLQVWWVRGGTLVGYGNILYLEGVLVNRC